MEDNEFRLKGLMHTVERLIFPGIAEAVKYLLGSQAEVLRWACNSCRGMKFNRDLKQHLLRDGIISL